MPITSNKTLTTLYITALILSSSPILVNAEAPHQDENLSSDYINSCAVCHGENGKGDGPMRSQLTTQPTDLTTLSLENGGSFPETVVYQVIDGRRIHLSHGSSEMPVWGQRFHIEEGNEDAVNLRITNIIEHLKSIQK